MTICTIDVHSRDVVSKMMLNKIESSFSFMWQSQLRHRWDNKHQENIKSEACLLLQNRLTETRNVICILTLTVWTAGLFREHLRRAVPLLARVPGQHPPPGHHPAHRPLLHHPHTGLYTVYWVPCFIIKNITLNLPYSFIYKLYTFLG